jgi:hypothetical protein
LLVIHPFAGAFDLSQADHLPRDFYVNQNALARENSTMAKKDINNVNQIETDIKAVAKAVTASLKRQGHAVPHSAVLHAVSASLNRRDWHKLKAAISDDNASVIAHPARAVSTFDTVWRSLPDQDKFWAAIAAAQGVHFNHTAGGWVGSVTMQERTVPAERCTTLVAAARAAMKAFNLEKDVSATLFVGSEELGTAMFALTGNGRFAHFNHAMERHASKLTYPVNAQARFRLGTTDIDCAAYGIAPDNWYFPSGGEGQLWEQVVGSVNFPEILGFPVTEDSFGVTAEFWTDDHLYEVSFDVTKALEASSDDHLERILWMGTSDNDCVDALAHYMSSTEPDILEALKYVGTVQAKGRTMGFGCSIDIREFRQWMDANRRIVLARWFCHEEGVVLRTRQSNSGASFYDWVYSPVLGGSEVKGWDFATEEAALLDAYEKCGRERGFVDRV